MQYQDQLDPSPIEETILVLLIQNKGFLNKLRHEEFNNIFFSYLRLLICSEFLYFPYIANLMKSRISKRVERLTETFVIIIISLVQEAFTLNGLHPTQSQIKLYNSIRRDKVHILHFRLGSEQIGRIKLIMLNCLMRRNNKTKD